MSIQIDIKYALQAGYRLKLFEQIASEHFLMRCPYCGDSKKSTTKRRGNLTRLDDTLCYHCFNCGVSKSFRYFLADVDPTLASMYAKETFQERKLLSWDYIEPKKSDGDIFTELFGEAPKKIIQAKNYDFHGLQPITSLKQTHPVRSYLTDRLLEPFLGQFYYCPRFYEWASQWKPDFIDLKKFEHPRLVLPFYDADGNEIGFTARSFGTETPKYIMIRTNDDGDMMYGLDKVDKTKPIYVVEGPIDSLMIPNAVAVCNANLYRYTGGDVYISDNQPRNREIVNIMEKTIRLGKSMVIWPASWYWKDLNDAMLDGVDIQEIIRQNTFHGLELKLKFNNWRKL